MAISPRDTSDTEAELWDLRRKLGISQKRFLQLLAEWKGHETEFLRSLRRKKAHADRQYASRWHKEWQQKEATEAEQRQALERPVQDAERAQERSEMSLGQWIDRLLAKSALLTSGPSQSFEAMPTHAGKPESKPPSAEIGLLHEIGVPESVEDFYKRRISYLARNWEREIDRHARKPPVDEDDELTPQQRHEQRILREGRGFRTWEVAAFDRTAGHPDTVKRIRDKHNASREDGDPIPKEKS